MTTSRSYTRAGRHLWASLLPLLVLAASACTRAKPEESAVKLSADEKKELDEYRAEIEIGRDMAGRLLTHFGSIDDREVLGYLNQVGNYVASYSDYPDRRYMFAILQTETVNAFACPGGYVLITLGALRNAQSEAQLAHVLGHEVAHVGKRHMFTHLKSMSKEEIDKKAKAGEEKLDEILRARSRVKPEETGTGAMLARYLSGSAGAGINILQAAKAGMDVILSTGLDHQLEYEADREGVKYAIRAGYEPAALKRFLENLEKKKGEAAKLASLNKTHPKTSTRITEINEVIKSMQASDIKGAVGDKRWIKIKRQLPKVEKN